MQRELFALCVGTPGQIGLPHAGVQEVVAVPQGGVLRRNRAVGHAAVAHDDAAALEYPDRHGHAAHASGSQHNGCAQFHHLLRRSEAVCQLSHLCRQTIHPQRHVAAHEACRLQGGQQAVQRGLGQPRAAMEGNESGLRLMVERTQDVERTKDGLDRSCHCHDCAALVHSAKWCLPSPVCSRADRRTRFCLRIFCQGAASPPPGRQATPGGCASL